MNKFVIASAALAVTIATPEAQAFFDCHAGENENWSHENHGNLPCGCSQDDSPACLLAIRNSLQICLLAIAPLKNPTNIEFASCNHWARVMNGSFDPGPIEDN
jgi:hypothetical protein